MASLARTLFLAGIPAALLLALAVPVSAVDLGDSAADWQANAPLPHGQWNYGHYANAASWNAFQPMAAYGIAYGPVIGSDGGTWNSPGYPFVGKYGASPSNTEWTVRRWTSNYTGPVTIDFDAMHIDGGGNGIDVGVYRNGTAVGTVTIGPALPHLIGRVTTTVNAGDVLDFIADARGDYSSDWIHSAVRIRSGTYTVPTGLLVHYTLDEKTDMPFGWTGTVGDRRGTAGDYSGNINHAKLSGMDPASDWVAGKIGGALDFDGADDQVNSVNANIGDGATELTVSAWIRPDTKNADHVGLVLGQSGPQLNGLLLTGYGSGRPPAFRALNAEVRASDFSGPTGQWTHLVGVWKSGSIQKLYINGVEVANNAAAPAGTVDLDYWDLANDRCCGGRFFDGLMDDASVWTKALSPAEVRAMYHAGLAGTNLADWQFAAQSQTGFSGTQGQSGWRYGYWAKDGDGYSAGEFAPLPQFVPGGYTLNGENFDVWRRGSAFPATYPMVGPKYMSPGDEAGQDYWAVRRWESNMAGDVLVDFEAYLGEQVANALVGAAVYVNGQLAWRRDMGSPSAPDPKRYAGQIVLSVQPGDQIDLMLDPRGVNWSDWAAFEASVMPTGRTWSGLDVAVQNSLPLDYPSPPTTPYPSLNEAFIVRGGTFQIGQGPANRADRLRVGVNEGRADSPNGTLEVNDATFNVYADQVLVGYNYGPIPDAGNEAHGTMNLNNSTTTIITPTMYIGGGGRITTGDVTVSGGSLQIGNAANRALLRIGYEDLYEYGQAVGTLTASGGADVSAWLTTLQVGYNSRGPGAPLGRGAVDLRNAAQTALDLSADMLIGNGPQINSQGYVYLGPGTATIAGDLTIGDTEAGSEGLLELFGTRVTVGDTLAIQPTGDVITHVMGASAGIELLSGDPADLAIASGGQMHVVFSPPTDLTSLYYGFKMAGDNLALLQGLHAAGRLTWDGSGLPPAMYVTTRFDAASNATYVLTAVPEPGTLALGALAALAFAVWAVSPLARRRRKGQG